MLCLPSPSCSLFLRITIIGVFVSASATAWNATLGLQDLSSFDVVESTQQPLVNLLSSKLEVVSLRNVLSTATSKTVPIELTAALNVIKGFRWSNGSGENSDAHNDLLTESWEPRGLTRGEERLDARTWGKDDRGDEHDYNLDEVLIVSWADVSNSSSYRNKGVRISFLGAPAEDEGQVRTYLHVLLVEAVEDKAGDGTVSFRALRNVHAGGLVWHGNWLYISDTSDIAIRVFDLNNILKVKRGNGIGFVGVGRFEAYNHSYVIPQTRAYQLSLPPGISFSCTYLTLGRNITLDGSVSLLAGESESQTLLARWKINQETSLPLITSESESSPPIQIATAEWVFRVSVGQVTGFALRGRQWFIAGLPSEGGALGKLLIWRPSQFTQEVIAFPAQLGGIVYKKKGDQILALNKEPGDTRGVWPFSASKLCLQLNEISHTLGSQGDQCEDPDWFQSSEPGPTVGNGGVRKDVIVGASVGAVFALLLGLVCILLFFERRKRRNEKPNCSNLLRGPQELEQNELSRGEAADIPELDGGHFRAELTGGEVGIELEE